MAARRQETETLPPIPPIPFIALIPSTSIKTLMAVKAALEEAGVEFTNGDAPGVRLKKREQGSGHKPAALRPADTARLHGRATTSPSSNSHPSEFGYTVLNLRLRINSAPTKLFFATGPDNSGRPVPLKQLSRVARRVFEDMNQRAAVAPCRSRPV